MRMIHYYLALAIPAPFLLLATLLSGLFHDGSERHVALGLFTAIFCVALNTLLILFMIVTGRVLKAAMQSRALGGEFLAELNRFFAEKRAYPVSLVAAALATATAVLGYGRFIGVPIAVHLAAGVLMVVVNLWALGVGYAALRQNQALMDRAALELDRIDARDAEAGRAPLDAGPRWAIGDRGRWLVYAASAWLPYLYWGLVVWRGDFGRVPAAFPALSAVVSVLFAAIALGRGATRPR